MTFTPSESGTYYARVSGDRDETGSYTLSLTDVALQQAVVVPGPPETEPESAQGQSTPGAGGRANVSEPDDGPARRHHHHRRGRGRRLGHGQHRPRPAGDKDWFAVELEASKRYQIDMEGSPTSRGTLAGSVSAWISTMLRGTPALVVDR